MVSYPFSHNKSLLKISERENLLGSGVGDSAVGVEIEQLEREAPTVVGGWRDGKQGWWCQLGIARVSRKKGSASFFSILGSFFILGSTIQYSTSVYFIINILI